MIEPYKKRPATYCKDKWKEYLRIVKSFEVLEISADKQKLMLEALHSRKWDWYQSDGCTCVSEVGWPSKYFPPCVRHDYRCAIGEYGIQTQIEFYQMNKAYRMTFARAFIRSLFTSIAAPFFKIMWLIKK